MRYHRALVSNNVVIVGGGIAGLAASVYLARAGKTVTIFERRRNLGGRAVTQLRHGYRFNLGPHAVYRAGAGSTVYRELGVPIRGGSPPSDGTVVRGGEHYALPASGMGVLTTGLLGAKGKTELASLMLRIKGMDLTKFAPMSVREWLDGHIGDERLREVMQMFVRVATYAADDRQSATVALEQLRVAQDGVIYLDEGWQKIVDSLHSSAVTSGVNFITSAHVVRVDHDNGQVRGIELGELELDNTMDTVSMQLPVPQSDGERGTRIPADCILLAIEPDGVQSLVTEVQLPEMEPVTAACLDVALSKLPAGKQKLAFGVDQPFYFSVHSEWAQLTPKGGALIHAAKYRKRGDDVSEAELETWLDDLQPGWRDVLVHKRYLPSMTVSNALVTPEMKRPEVKTHIRGLYLAGDWVGGEGILSDAALSSARAAAHAILEM
ncbi:MAG TPA: FAD-dependent oxidoreductase [Thermoanaerobaculia bacterium]|jgi:phytoene dehydrogenase-like protein|nr:FAD-dependent oxidoreductase [Thermoanaerobaculia bacterium]